MKSRIGKILIACFVVVTSFNLSAFVKADVNEKINITKDMITAKATKGKEISLAIDGKKDTFWQSVESIEGTYEGMDDHNRYIDIELDGTYDLSQIKIFNKVDSAFNNYYIYTSVDGTNFNKMVSKTDNKTASAGGDTFEVTGKASYIRLNMAYNSNSFVTNLAEIEIYGNKLSNEVKKTAKMETTPWEGSSYQKEWDKVAGDQAYANQKTLQEASALVGRVIGDKWKSSFVFELRDTANGTEGQGNDVFEIEDGADGKIVVRGNDGVSLASGFNYYLKNFVAVDFNPLFASNVQFDKIVPVKKKIVKETQYDYRYALNFCTYSYTMSFWGWEQYEEFIDWAAMNGVNLMLDIVGQEEVLRQMLSQFNYTDQEIKDYISGPAYFAWFYMQNLYSMGGPLPDNWFEQRVELGRKMHDRMQTYGIDPVVQGFAGQVPVTFADKNEGAVLAPKDGWPSFVRPAIIKTYLSDAEIAAGKKNYFAEAANKFYEAQTNVFGNVSNFYASDPFHEGGNTTGLDTTRIYGEVQSEMLKSNKDAIWVMQQWQGNLNDAKLRGLVKPEQSIALDLQSDLNQQNGIMEQRNVPWIYNMLHNFGGRMGLDGEIEKMATDPAKTFQNKEHMVGIGITPEALENSPIAYEMIFDMTWSKDPVDYQKWTQKYAERRAGGTNAELEEAWEILLGTAYANKGKYFQGAAESVVNSRPGDNFNSASTWGHSDITYDKKELEKALVLLAKNFAEFKDSPAYVYDLADVSEQVLSNAAIEYQRLMVKAKNEKNIDEFQKLSKHFLDLIDLSDKVLNSTDEFMVGTWIHDSREMLKDADDWTKDLFEFNARALVTTWGCQKSGSLKDYSNRKWAGLTKDFYKERWEIWVRNREAELKGVAKDAADKKAEDNWFLWEWQWVNQKSDDGFAYSNKPTTDKELGNLANEVYEKFSVTNMDKFTSGPADQRVNIAKGKTVTSASETETGDIMNLTDDDTNSEWKPLGVGPHVIEIDLEATYQLNEIDLFIKQAATDYPYDYIVETHNPDTNTWEVVKEQINGIMESSVLLETTNTADKIRMSVTTRDVGIPVLVTEIRAYGEIKDAKTYYNVAKGKTVTTTKTTTSPEPQYGLDKIVDENLSTFWKTTDWGVDANKNATVSIDLANEFNVEYVEVYFETAGRPFQFNVEVEDVNGAKHKVLDKSDNAGGLELSYKIPVDQDIVKVYVNITGSNGQGSCEAACGLSGPAIAEVKAMSLDAPVDESKDIIFAEGKIDGVKRNGVDAAIDRTLDGNIDTFEGNLNENEMVYELPALYYVDHVLLTFEKAELGLKYRVYGEDINGVRTLLSDTTESKNTLGNREIKINVTSPMKKIIFIHLGNNGAGPASLAEKRLYEFAAYSGSPKNILTDTTIDPDEGKSLIDNNIDTSYSFTADSPKEMIVTLKKFTDIHMVNVVKKADETKTVKYKVEYFDEETNKWVLFIDMSSNKKTSIDNYGMATAAAYTNKLKFIIGNDTIDIAELRAFEIDQTKPLVEKIKSTEAVLASKEYLGYAGNYTLEAKAKVESVLQNAQTALDEGLSSKGVALWMNTIDTAMKDFYKNGVVYIDRSSLLRKLSDVEIVIAKVENLENEAVLASLKAAHAAAKKSYDTPRQTQADLDKAEADLTVAFDAAMEALDIVEQYQIVLKLAERKLADAVVGEGNGNVSEITKNALTEAIKKAKADFKAAGDDQEKITLVIEDLTSALEAFDKAIIVVDKQALAGSIKEAEDKETGIYDKHTWAAMQDALSEARHIYEKENATLTEVKNAANLLDKAISELIPLDKETLKGLVDQARSYVADFYTEESWSVFKTAYEKAESLLAGKEVAQKEINEALASLDKAMQGLVKLPERTIISADRVIEATGTFTKDTVLLNKELSEMQKQELMNKVLEKGQLKNAVIERLFHISLQDKGVEIQPNGMLKVSITLDKTLLGKSLGMIHIAEDGSIKVIQSVVEGNKIIFYVDTLSNFALISYESGQPGIPEVPNPDKPNTSPDKDSGNVNTSDATNMAALLLLFVLSGGFILMRKMKKER